MKKTLLHGTAIILLMMGTSSYAYWWRFNNFTTKTLLLKVKLLASNNPYYAVVHPDMSVLFDWSPPNGMAGFCFQKLEWIEAPREILNNRALVSANHSAVDNRKMHEQFFGSNARFTLNEGEIHFIPTWLYGQTLQGARNVARGIDSVFCLGQTSENDSCPFILDKIIQWGFKVHAQSPCRSRNISIVEDKEGEIYFISGAQ